jgi:hypothetical protein
MILARSSTFILPNAPHPATERVAQGSQARQQTCIF